MEGDQKKKRGKERKNREWGKRRTTFSLSLIFWGSRRGRGELEPKGVKENYKKRTSERKERPFVHYERERKGKNIKEKRNFQA